MRHKISKIFVVIIALNVIFVSNIFGAVNFNVSSQTISAGEEVTIDVSINDNSGFVGYQILLNYDISKLEYISSSNGDLVSSKMAIISDNKDKGNVKQACVSTDVINQNGKLMSITFKAKENITVRTIPLELVVKEIITDVGEGNVKDVEYTVSNGSITLKQENGSLTSATSNDKIEILKDQDGKFKVNIKDTSISENIAYRSLNEAVATVDENGNITVLGTGDVEIETLVNDEVIDKATLHIPSSEEIEQVNNTENLKNTEDLTYATNNKKKYLIIASIAVTVIIIVIIIIILLKKKGRVNNNEKK